MQAADGVELIGLALRRMRSIQLRGQQNARRRGAEAGHGKDEQLDLRGVDTGVFEHLLIAAEAVDLRANGGLGGHEHAGEDEHHHDIIGDRHAQERTVAQEDIALRKAAERATVVEQIGSALRDLTDDQRGDKGRHLQIGVEDAGNQPDQESRRQRREYGHHHRHAHAQQQAGQHAAEGDVAAHGKVDALDDDDLRDADRADGDDRALADHVEEIGRLEEIRHERPADEKSGQHARGGQERPVFLGNAHWRTPPCSRSLESRGRGWPVRDRAFAAFIRRCWRR